MRRFRFRLEGLLRLRRVRERQARRELAQALRAVREAEERCQTARAAVQEAEARVRDAQDAAALRWWGEAVELRRRQLAQAERAHDEASQRASALWARFLQVRQDRKVVEQVRQRRWKVHQREQLRREQALLDELVLLRRGRRG